MPFAIYSGNGQVVAQGRGTVEELQVRLTDGGGLPVVGSTVTWAIASGTGSIFAASYVTDADGVAGTRFAGGAIGTVAAEGYETSVVRASTLGEADVDFYATTINFKLGGTADLMPGALVRSPLGYGVRVTGQAGQMLVGYITVEVGFFYGGLFTTALPNIGVELVPPDEAAYLDPVLASALGGPALTNGAGIATLNVTLGPSIATGMAKLKIGIPSYDGTYLCWWPVYLTARAAALPAFQLYNWSDYGAIGTLSLPGADSTAPANQVRVHDAAGIPAPGVAVLWESVTAGALTFVNSELVTDADGIAHSDILLSVTAGDFQARVTSLGESVLFTFHIMVPNDMPTVTPPSLFPTGAPSTGPVRRYVSSGPSGAGSGATVNGASVDRSSKKNASIGIPEITTEDLKPEALVFKLNQILRLLADQVARVQGNNGPFTFGEEGLTLSGNAYANQNLRVQKTLHLQGECDRNGNVSPIEFLDDLPAYADNATAIAYGLGKGRIYRTSTGQLAVVY